MENKTNYAAMSLDEIIFIDRNRDYGAFELRQSYRDHMKRAVLGTIFLTSFTIALLNIYAILHHSTAAKTIETIVNLSKVKNIAIKLPPTPPQQAKAQLKHGTPTAATATAPAEMQPVTDRTNVIDTIAPPTPEIDISDHAQDGKTGEQAGSALGSAPIESPKAEAPKEGQVFTWAEKMPEFPGGEDAMRAYIGNHLSYPNYELENNIHGKTIVGFVVNDKGKVTNVKVLKGLSPGIDREAMRVVRSLPDFTPGMQSGRPVSVSFVLPIDFRGEE